MNIYSESKCKCEKGRCGMQNAVEDSNLRRADRARRKEWKSKGFPGNVASAHDKWHERSECWRAGCDTQHACGGATECGLPPRGQLEDGNQSVYQEQTR